MIQGKVNEYLSRAEVLKSHLSNSSEKSPVGLANGNGTAATKKLVETNHLSPGEDISDTEYRSLGKMGVMMI